MIPEASTSKTAISNKRVAATRLDEHAERQISCDITYMWSLKKRYKLTYLQNRNRVTDVENKLMVTGGGERRGRDKLGDWD